MTDHCCETSPSFRGLCQASLSAPLSRNHQCEGSDVSHSSEEKHLFLSMMSLHELERILCELGYVPEARSQMQMGSQGYSTFSCIDPTMLVINRQYIRKDKYN